MGIDISKLGEDEMLEKLGDGDWHLIIGKQYPELIVTTQFREECLAMVAEWFVRWVKNGKDRNIHHDWDPSWDRSGRIRESQADPLFLLTRYETMQEWLENAHTGNSTASYQSGHGLYWDTYDEDLYRELQSKVFHLVADAMFTFLSIENPDLVDIEEYDEYDDYHMTEICLPSALQQEIYLYKTADIWCKYEPEIQARITREQIETEIRRQKYLKMRELATTFWNAYFSDALLEDKIEAPQFDALKMGERLKDILADTDPVIVEAIAEVSWIGHCSNSVKYEIEHIAKRALE